MITVAQWVGTWPWTVRPSSCPLGILARIRRRLSTGLHDSIQRTTLNSTHADSRPLLISCVLVPFLWLSTRRSLFPHSFRLQYSGNHLAFLWSWSAWVLPLCMPLLLFRTGSCCSRALGSPLDSIWERNENHTLVVVGGGCCREGEERRGDAKGYGDWGWAREGGGCR